MTTIVSIAQGGTGSNSAALARTALGVPPSAAYDQANTARDQANTAYGQANTAYDQANSAYGTANTRLSASGGTLAGDLIITGNLTVSGNSTTLNTEILTVEDADIVLLSNVASTPALNAGIIVNRGTSTNTFLRWNEVTDRWGWSDDGTTFYNLDTSLSAYAQANSAYGAANNRVLKAGDTMTGQLNISAGGLLVTGNVGIGTSSPQSKLEVATSSGDFSHFGATSTTNGQFTGITLGYRENNSLYRKAAIVQEQIGDNSARGHLHLLVDIANDGGSAVLGDSKLMIHGTTGNIGIGTTSPGVRLDVIGTNTVGRFQSSTTYADIQFINSTSSAGYFQYNGNDFRIYANSGSTPTMSITGGAPGNVGIGTTSPGKLLDVAGEIRLTTGLTITAVNSSLYNQDGTLSYYQNNNAVYLNGAGASGWLRLNGSGVENTRNCIDIYGSGGDRIEFRAANAERMRLNSTGLGIGTTNPGAALDVNGTIRSRSGAFQLNDGTTTGGGLYFYKSITGSGSVLDPSIFAEGSSGTGNVHIMTGGSVTTRMWVGHNGRVGIGTTSPGNPLTVNGTIQAINGEIWLTQNYGITWNNGDNYIKGVGGYHVDVTTYDGSSAQQDGIRVVGGTSKSARLIAYGGVRYGRALQSTAANKVIRGWHNYTTSGSSSGTIYVHFKTNMWAGGSPSGNIQYTMSLFRATGYSYNAHTIDSLIGFHNWSGSHYNIKITDLGSKAFWSTVYTSADGYTVLVGNLSNYNYDAVSIDWFQIYEYPFVDAWVTAQSTSANLTGVY